MGDGVSWPDSRQDDVRFSGGEVRWVRRGKNNRRGKDNSEVTEFCLVCERLVRNVQGALV